MDETEGAAIPGRGAAGCDAGWEIPPQSVARLEPSEERSSEDGIGNGPDAGDSTRAEPLRCDRRPLPEVRVIVGCQHVGTVGGQSLDHSGAGGTSHEVQSIRSRDHRHVVVDGAPLVVPGAGGLGEARRLAVGAGAGFVVGVTRAWAEDEMTAGLGVRAEPLQQVVVGDIEAGDDQHRMLPGPETRRHPRPVDPDKVLRVHDAHRGTRIEGCPVERLDNARVGGGVTGAVGADQ